MRQDERRLPKVSTDQISEILPDHFEEYYPQLIKLFEYYFEYLRDEDSPSALVDQFFKTRDISAVSEELLSYLQQELLLGVDYFQGFSDPRDALRLNNLLYRSKGSRYSMEQFFRFFFGITPEVVYTKNNVFIIDESNIGYESQKFITNDKLYQTFAVLIKVPFGLDQWRDVYKLFVHPAGVYLGAQVELLSCVDLSPEAYSNEETEFIGPLTTGTADVTFEAVTEITGDVDDQN